jgi:metal-sulfur cluster biosynthetic enzyme
MYSYIALQNFKRKILLVIKLIYDPEILVNLWDLGLIFNINIINNNIVDIKLTLTSFFCPFYVKIFEEIRSTLYIIFINLKHINIDVIWEIKWHFHMINKNTKFILDIL